MSPANVFMGVSYPFNESRFILVGVPFDKTSTYRPGSRFGPSSIREYSRNLELYSPRFNINLEELKVCDLGDIEPTADAGVMVDRITRTITDIVKEEKIPILLGGEHTITLGAIRSMPPDTCIVSFDAHYDLRDEYEGARLSHATFLRRAVEERDPSQFIHVGGRASCQEERDFLRKNHIREISSLDMRRKASGETSAEIQRHLSGFRNVYLTVDMDVFDPAYAPGVGNPEPDGVDGSLLLDVIAGICDHRIVGFDVVEVSPPYDSGITATLAAKVCLEIFAGIHHAKEH